MSSGWAVCVFERVVFFLSMIKVIFTLWRLNVVYCCDHLVYNTAKIIDLNMR